MKKLLLIVTLGMFFNIDAVFAQAKQLPESVKPATTSERKNLLSQTDRPLYLLDDKEANQAQIDSLPQSSIESVQVFKGAQAIALYGDKGRNGVIAIRLKKPKK